MSVLMVDFVAGSNHDQRMPGNTSKEQGLQHVVVLITACRRDAGPFEAWTAWRADARRGQREGTHHTWSLYDDMQRPTRVRVLTVKL